PEAPVPIVDVSVRIAQPGGAANSAVNALGLGAGVLFLSVVGDDFEGQTLLRDLHRRGVDPAHIFVEPGRRTLAKQRVLADSHLLVRYDQGGPAPVDGAVEQQIADRLEALWACCNAVLVSDYAYGVMTPQVIAKLARLQACNPRVLVIDSKRLPLYRSVKPTA